MATVAGMKPEQTPTAANRKLIRSLYTEAMLLADEARAYFDRNGREERLALDPMLRIGFSCESLKVTTRLMHVVAWLLTQRGLEAGELGVNDADDQDRQLGDVLPSDPEVVRHLPQSAIDLIRQSEDLYARIQRLIEARALREPSQSPARSLINRLQRAF